MGHCILGDDRPLGNAMAQRFVAKVVVATQWLIHNFDYIEAGAGCSPNTASDVAKW